MTISSQTPDGTPKRRPDWAPRVCAVAVAVIATCELAAAIIGRDANSDWVELAYRFIRYMIFAGLFWWASLPTPPDRPDRTPRHWSIRVTLWTITVLLVLGAGRTALALIGG